MGKIIFYWLIGLGFISMTATVQATEWNSFKCTKLCTEVRCQNPTTLKECQTKCQKFQSKLADCFKNSSPPSPNLRPLPTPPTKPIGIKPLGEKPPVKPLEKPLDKPLGNPMVTPQPPQEAWNYAKCNKGCSKFACQDQKVLSLCKSKCSSFPKILKECLKVPDIVPTKPENIQPTPLLKPSVKPIGVKPIGEKPPIKPLEKPSLRPLPTPPKKPMGVKPAGESPLKPILDKPLNKPVATPQPPQETWNYAKCNKECPKFACQAPKVLSLCKSKCSSFPKILEECLKIPDVLPTKPDHIQPTPTLKPSIKPIGVKPMGEKPLEKPLNKPVANPQPPQEVWNYAKCNKECPKFACQDSKVLSLCKSKCPSFPKILEECLKIPDTLPTPPEKPLVIKPLRPLPTLNPKPTDVKPLKETLAPPPTPSFLANGLPADMGERDKFLKRIYEKIFPILLSYDAANGGIFLDTRAKNITKSSTTPPLKWVYVLPGELYAPIPFAPYQMPDPFRTYLLPQNKDELQANNLLLSSQKRTCDIIKSLLQNMLTESQLSTDLSIAANLSPTLWEAYLQQHYISNATTYKTFREFIESTDPTDPQPTTTIKLTKENVEDIKKLYEFYDYQSASIEKYLEKFDTPETLDLMDRLWVHRAGKIPLWKKGIEEKKYQQALELSKQLRPYFLKGRKAAHRLINVKELQEMATPKKEQVIVLDSSHIHSPYLTYSKNYIKDRSATETHSLGVAGIIGMNEETHRMPNPKYIMDIENHIKGVAPGVQTLPIDWIQTGTTEQQKILRMIEDSSARVINISVGLNIPQRCATAPVKNGISPISPKTTDKECKFLYDVFDLINKKDMLVVVAAGNEGVQCENFKWPLGRFLDTPAPYHSRGVQYLHEVRDDGYLFWEDMAYVYKNFPMIKDRVILVGNLKEDGVTVDPSSALAGVAADDFIYAPSGDIITLKESTREIEMEGKTYIYKTPFDKFGGTSGAAPRVAGVLVLLSNVFKKALDQKALTMGDLRQCVLDSGDPFWLLKENKFDELKDLCGVNTDLQRVIYTNKPSQKLVLKGGRVVSVPDNPTRFNPNWRRDNPSLSATNICPKPYEQGRRLYGRGRINAMAAFDKCLDLLSQRYPKIPLINWFSQSK